MNRSVVVGALMGAVAASAVAVLAERSFPHPPIDAAPPLDGETAAGMLGGCGTSSLQGASVHAAPWLDEENDPWLNEPWFPEQED